MRDAGLPHDLLVAIQRVDNRAEMVSHPTFQEPWGMLVDMNFKVGSVASPRAVVLGTALGTLRYPWFSSRRIASTLSSRPGNSSAGGGSPGAVRFLFNLHPLIYICRSCGEPSGWSHVCEGIQLGGDGEVDPLLLDLFPALNTVISTSDQSSRLQKRSEMSVIHEIYRPDVEISMIDQETRTDDFFFFFFW